ncbi:hypothetical protein DICVIV_01641 [Dictyocaulus viviparus]|uniref:Uncharacterized protein n=1 Tax=Dictyocaulus viviparus TaxID=29172 RepID=A0A0D8YC94_DICVI|nr:hypothetical protein DICVIV_01641 [Dictyocaulus viviparus]
MAQSNDVEIAKVPYIDSSDSNSAKSVENVGEINIAASLDEAIMSLKSVIAVEENSNMIENQAFVVPDSKANEKTQNKSYGSDNVNVIMGTASSSEKTLIANECEVLVNNEFRHSSIDQPIYAAGETKEMNSETKSHFQFVQTQFESPQFGTSHRLPKRLDCRGIEEIHISSIPISTRVVNKQEETKNANITVVNRFSTSTGVSHEDTHSLKTSRTENIPCNNLEQEEILKGKNSNKTPIMQESSAEQTHAKQTHSNQKTPDDKITKKKPLSPPPKPQRRNIDEVVPMDMVTNPAPPSTSPTPPPRKNSLMTQIAPPTPSLSIRSFNRHSSVASSRINTMNYNISRGILTFPTLPRNARPPTREQLQYARNRYC